MFEGIYILINALLNFIGSAGYFGIFLGMVIESSFFPFPSEAIIIPAGVLVAKGELSLGLVFLFGVFGSVVGALINYFLAFFLGRGIFIHVFKKYRKFLFISRENLSRSERYFSKHGEITTFVGRLIPGVRQLISIPAGFSRMNIVKFIIFTGLGAGIWTLILIYVGLLFGNNPLWLATNKDILTGIIIFFSVILLIGYFIINKRRKTKSLLSSR